MRKPLLTWGTLGALCGASVLAGGCRYDMWVQPKVQTYEQSDFYRDGLASRPVVPNTVQYGQPKTDAAFYQGRLTTSAQTPGPTTAAKPGAKPAAPQLVATLPADLIPKHFASTREMLDRGQQQYYAYCTPCHGRAGDGQGMITKRGLGLRKMPASYHTDRLRNIQIGHFYDVITNGFGIMYSYASRIQPEDRWAIAAYVRVLQYSQNAPTTDVPAEELARLNAMKVQPGLPPGVVLPPPPMPGTNGNNGGGTTGTTGQ